MEHVPIKVTIVQLDRRWSFWRTTAELAFWVILFGIAVWI